MVFLKGYMILCKNAHVSTLMDTYIKLLLKPFWDVPNCLHANLVNHKLLTWVNLDVVFVCHIVLPSPSQIFLVRYLSGTTGLPLKCVILEDFWRLWEYWINPFHIPACLASAVTVYGNDVIFLTRLSSHSVAFNQNENKRIINFEASCQKACQAKLV